MAKMREVRRYNVNSGEAIKKTTSNVYTTQDGVKVTKCKPGPAPKKLTARCKG